MLGNGNQNHSFRAFFLNYQDMAVNYADCKYL